MKWAERFLPRTVNEMRTVWFRELCCYSERDVCKRLELTEEQVTRVIDRLMKNNIVRRVRNVSSSTREVLPDDMDEIFTDDEYYWAFTFVGIVILDDIVICCYPKYLKNIREEDRAQVFAQIMAVIRKYEKTREQHINLAEGVVHTETHVNFLAIVMEIIEQYQKNGFYKKNEIVEEINGDGDIDWERTINQTQTIISHGRPFYPELYTRQYLWDDMNFFYCLHRCIVSECFDVIENADLSAVLGINDRYHTGIYRNSLGTDEYLLRRIDQEMSRQFVTSKQKMLQLMRLYLIKQGKHTQAQLLFYGTNIMNLVWEAACGIVVGNQLRDKVCDIGELSGKQMQSFEAKSKSLLQLIDRPEWIFADCETGHKKDTLIPDSIRIRRNPDGNRIFSIYDAKYYNIVFCAEEVSGQPGIASITKQYLYHLAYSDFLKHFGITTVQNIFLFPSESGSQWLGRVTMPMLKAVTGADIYALALDASMVFKYYLEEKELPSKDLIYQHGHTYEIPTACEYAADSIKGYYT